MNDPRRRIVNAWTAVRGRAQDLLERIQAQLGFAQNLCELHLDRASAWQKLIAEAATLVERAAGGDLSALERAVREAEEILGPVGKVAKRYTI